MARDDGDTLRQAVFGANDGLVSTFGLLAGLIGAAVSTNMLLIASIVNMFASGMSMGLGSYLSTKSEVEFHRKLEAEERLKIRHHRSKAEAELLFLFKQRGVPTKQLKAHMSEVMRSEEDWLLFILEEKYGLGAASFPDPIKGGFVMFVVFVACGFIPILPILFMSGMSALIASAALTAVALFAVGALKHKLTQRTWLSLGMENLLIGAITGAVGFVAGIYTAGLVG
jgi:vacuolar iron transporter family protein